MANSFSAKREVVESGETSDQEPADPDDEGPGGELYAEFIQKELEHERTRRSALEARAVTVITTSGTFVTLTFALAALLTKGQNYTPSRLATLMLALALGAFVVAAVCALLASRLRGYQVVATEQLDTWRDDGFWLDDMDNARWLLAATDAKTIASLREGSNAKAKRIEVALWARIFGAFGLLALAVLAVFVESLRPQVEFRPEWRRAWCRPAHRR